MLEFEALQPWLTVLLLAVFWILFIAVVFNRVELFIRTLALLAVLVLLILISLKLIAISLLGVLTTAALGIFFNWWRVGIKADSRTTKSLLFGIMIAALFILPLWLKTPRSFSEGGLKASAAPLLPSPSELIRPLPNPSSAQENALSSPSLKLPLPSGGVRWP